MEHVMPAPLDGANRKLIENVHPPGWVNPEPGGRYNLVVVGGGTAGLVAAAGAAGLGARVALVERHLLGGDCLNVGCVPSKAILRSARAVAEVREAERYGVRVVGEPDPDFAAIMGRMREIRASISGHDSARRFAEHYGVDVYLGEARFVARDAVEVEGARLVFSRAVIATGARALVPPIPGLAEVGYLTNETVFNLTDLPPRLGVVGGGPIGCEMAQAFARFGSRVTILEMMPQFLPREDPAAAEVLLRALREDGVDVRLGTRLHRVEKGPAGTVLHVTGPGGEDTVTVDAVLVAVGRAPNVEGLGLEEAGVEYDTRKGVEVDDHLRTTNPRIFAAGDVCLPEKFTHTADAAARIVLQNAFFPFAGRRRWSREVIPWCTYTDPEVAQVGLTEAEAVRRGIPAACIEVPMRDVDRALAEGDTRGFLKVVVRRGGDRILGATLVSRHAGETISELTLAMATGTGLGQLARVIHPYPTQAEAIRKAADAYNRTRLTPRAARWLRRYFAWRR